MKYFCNYVCYSLFGLYVMYFFYLSWTLCETQNSLLKICRIYQVTINIYWSFYTMSVMRIEYEVMNTVCLWCVKK